MLEILEKAKNTHNLEKSEIIQLLNGNCNDLFFYANEIRKKYKGDEVHLRGLIEFTNICKCDCMYCGLRCENKKVDRYRMGEEEILSCVQKAVSLGYKTVVLQGGEDSFFSTDKICSIIEKIKKYDVAITLSIGERSYDDYKTFKNAGLDRYLLRIETTDENLYKTMHPNMSLENRFRCLYDLKSLKIETGTGNLIGLPNQTVESIAEDILFFKKLDADMIGIGPFIPHQDTPLAKCNKDNFDLSLKTMAIVRLLLPDINIPATTAMETIRKDGRKIALNSGANVVMPNVSDEIFRKKYEIYPDKAVTCDAEVRNLLKSINRYVSNSRGFRKN